MKKIVIFISLLLLTGCFKNSGYITKSCVKQEHLNSLNLNTTYTFKFKQDIIDELKIKYEYNDENNKIISSIKKSLESENKFLNINSEVLLDDKNNYIVEYNIPLDNEEILKKYKGSKSRTKLVKELEKDNFICK